VFELTPEQEAIRATARAFAEREVAPHAAQWDRDEHFPAELIPRLAEVGFLGAPVPVEYGGMGLDAVSYAVVIEEIARADSSVRSIVSVNCSLFALTVLKWGTEAQRKEWLPKVSGGEMLGCFGLTEPGAGSDPGSMVTRAVRDGEHWVIDGSKMFITNGTQAGIALIFAQTDPSRGAKGIACFLVPTATPGFAANEIHGKLGLRASSTAELVLTGVRVGPESLLGEVGDGMKIALSTLDNGRVGLAASCVGLAQASLDAALAYAKDREQFGKPIARHQLVQEMLADMYVDVEAARLLTLRAAAKKDAGERNTLEASVAKYYASEAAVRCTNLAIQVHGGYGYVDEYPVGRYLRDARVTTLYEGTSQIQKLIIGRHLTGESAFV